MKREVWVECESKEKNRMEVKNTWNNILMYFKPETLHESRWIPVSERMPDKPGHYHVVRLDREDWAMLLLSDAKCGAPGFYYWNHSNVTHWLETPPLPVTEEVEPTDERFEQWYDYTRSVIRTENATSKQFMKSLSSETDAELFTIYAHWIPSLLSMQLLILPLKYACGEHNPTFFYTMFQILPRFSRK